MISLIKCIEQTHTTELLTNLKSTNGSAYTISFISDSAFCPELREMATDFYPLHLLLVWIHVKSSALQKSLSWSCFVQILTLETYLVKTSQVPILWTHIMLPQPLNELHCRITEEREQPSTANVGTGSSFQSQTLYSDIFFLGFQLFHFKFSKCRHYLFDSWLIGSSKFWHPGALLSVQATLAPSTSTCFSFSKHYNWSFKDFTASPLEELCN